MAEQGRTREPAPSGGGVDRGLQFEDVLDCLDDQYIDSAVDETPDLVEEELDHLVEPVISEHRVFGCREETGRANRTGHEAGAGGRAVPACHTPGELGGLPVQLIGEVADAVLLEFGQATAEGVGFEDVCAHFEE